MELLPADLEVIFAGTPITATKFFFNDLQYKLPNISDLGSGGTLSYSVTFNKGLALTNRTLRISAVGQPSAHSDTLTHYITIQIVPSLICSVPTSGNWFVTQDCSLQQSATAPANVIVQENVALTIASGVMLDINFSSNHLKIKNGAKVVIENGGKIE